MWDAIVKFFDILRLFHCTRITIEFKSPGLMHAFESELRRSVKDMSMIAVPTERVKDVKIMGIELHLVNGNG